MDDISKERFNGTVLKALSKFPRKEVKKEPEEEKEEEQGRTAGIIGQVPKTYWKRISWKCLYVKPKIKYVLFPAGQS